MNPRLRISRHSVADGCEESGQALIELAITMPLLFILLLGAAEFGRLAYMAIEVSEAAKAAAQYGAQNLTTAADSGGISLTAQQNAPYVYANCTSFSATAPNTKTTMQCACMSSGSPTGSPSNATCTAACTGYVVQVLTVTTSATCSPVFAPSGFSHAGITLNGSAVQEVLN
jgi:Flp pilus assembly protein TadG